jgi:predicted secreted protein
VAVPRLSSRAGFALLSLALLACAAGCASLPGFASKKVYREGASTITGRTGESIVIELASDPTTGFSWMQVGYPDPRIVALMESDYAQVPPTAAGAPGHQRWTFRLTGPGTVTITFGYGRTWANAPAEKATMFTVVVR